MQTEELLKSCDEFYGRILRHVDVTLEDPEHRRVAKRIICSWITGAEDNISNVMDGLAPHLDHLEIKLWVMLEGLQYEDNDLAVSLMRPVFVASGLADMFDCIVECMQMLEVATQCTKTHVGGARIVPYKVAFIKNRIRTYASLSPVTTIESGFMDAFICAPVVTLYMFHKWRTEMLWRRIREYVRCLYQIVPDRVTETRDVMGHVICALGL